MAKLWAVTGATGLLGNNVVRRLCADGERVRVLVRGAARKEIAGLPVEVVVGELDAGPLHALVQGADYVVHAAASVKVGVTGRAAMERINVGGTQAVCEAIRAAELRGASARLIHVSSVDALGLGTRERPATEDTPPRPEEGGVPYVDTKRAADHVVRSAIVAGLDAVIVHPTYMIGPNDWGPSSGKMLLEIARGKGVIAPRGGNNFVDVRDVVAGILRVSERDAAAIGSAWILGNENLSYLEAWTRMAKVVGARAPVAETPRWVGLTVAAMLHAPRLLGIQEGDINPASTRMSFLPHYFDPSKAQRLLGIVPTPLDRAFADAWVWFQDRGYAARKLT
jgi:dihydroflavonol-4-reductase